MPAEPSSKSPVPVRPVTSSGTARITVSPTLAKAVSVPAKAPKAASAVVAKPAAATKSASVVQKPVPIPTEEEGEGWLTTGLIGLNALLCWGGAGLMVSSYCGWI